MKIKNKDTNQYEEIIVEDNELDTIRTQQQIINRQGPSTKKSLFKTNREFIIAISFFVFGVLFAVFFFYVIVAFVSIISTAIFMYYYYKNKKDDKS